MTTYLVEAIPVDDDAEGRGLPVMLDLEATAAASVPEATETVEGTVMQAAFQPDAAGANPTAAEYDALLAALIAAGIMAAS